MHLGACRSELEIGAIKLTFDHRRGRGTIAGDEKRAGEEGDEAETGKHARRVFDVSRRVK